LGNNYFLPRPLRISVLGQEVDAHGRTAAWLALDRQPAALFLDHSLNGGHSQSAAVQFGREKKLAHSFAGRLVHSLTGICYGQTDIITELVRQAAGHGGDRFQPLKMVDLLFCIVRRMSWAEAVGVRD